MVCLCSGSDTRQIVNCYQGIIRHHIGDSGHGSNAVRSQYEDRQRWRLSRIDHITPMTATERYDDKI